MTAPIDFPDFAQAVNPPFALTSEAKASGGVSFNVPLPVGTVCVSLGVSSPFALETLTMTGHTTGESYTESSPIGDWVNYPLQWFPIDPADHSVDIVFQASTDTCTLYVGGSMTPVAVALTPGDQIFAELVGANGVTVTTVEQAAYGPGPLNLALAVTVPNPQPWDVPNQLPLTLNVSIAATGAHTLITPASGKQIWLHSIHLDFNEPVNAFGDFKAGSTVIMNWAAGGAGGTTAAGKSSPWLAHGCGLGVGNALILDVNGGASGQTLNGWVVYSVA